MFICSLRSGATPNGPDLKCLYCKERFEEIKHLEDHRETCAKRPPPVLQAPSVEGSRGSESPVINPTPRERWCQKPVHPDDQVRFPINEFTEYLKLSARGKAGETLKEEERSRQVECMDLDLDEEPCQTSLTSTPTKSSKTLLSQLSRDFSPPSVPVKSPRLKSVSEDNDGENTEGKPNIVVGDLDLDDSLYEDDSDSDSDGGTSYKTEWERANYRVRSSASLLTIDLSSPLGRRIKEKYTYKRPKPVEQEDTDDELEGYEKYCHTPKKTIRFVDRLRNRDTVRDPNDFPITFNRRKRIPDHKCHYIKFTKRDREEFLITLKTGLTTRARRLKKKIKPCSVKLKRITEAEIEKWRPKPMMFQRWSYSNTTALNNLYPLANYPLPVPAHLHNAQIQQRMLLLQQRQLQLQQRAGLVSPQLTPGGEVPLHLAKDMFAPHLNGYLNMKRQSSTTNSNDSDLICISSDDDDDVDIKVTAAKAPTSGAPNLQRRASQTGIIRFKCHLCSAEINGQLGSTDFIAEHFGKCHDVHNIRLHQSVDVNGQTVVTIVQDIPKGTTLNNPAPASTNNAAMSTNEKPATTADDDVICID